MLSDAPVVTVHVPACLRVLAGGHRELMASGDTVGEVLQTISHEYPAIRAHLMTGDGDLVPALSVFLGPRSVRELNGLATPIEQAELISLILTDKAPA